MTGKQMMGYLAVGPSIIILLVLLFECAPWLALSICVVFCVFNWSWMSKDWWRQR